MPTDRERQLDEIITAYLKACEAGAKPDPDEWLARYPQLAAELAEFFAGQASLDRLAAPLRPGPAEPATGVDTATIDHLGTPTEAAPSLTVRYFGDYELLGEIARGGMGVVYRARQVSLDRPVALKMILAGQLASDDDVRRFHAEAEAAANLDHPHIVPIYEVGQHQGQHYFSMKLIDGAGLNHCLGRYRDDPRAAAQLLAAVARGVHHAHQRGILHRDLKPGNILVDGRGQPHVTDFGLAKRVEGDSELTRTGAIVGTPEYMAPEQAAAQRLLTTEVDVYSLGAVLYAMLTGVPPFSGGNVLETLRQVAGSEPAPLRRRNPSVPLDLQVICLKCLAKEPLGRYGSAEALAADLERWLRGEPIVARPAGRLERAWKWVRRNPALAATMAAAVFFLVGGAAAATWFGLDANQQARWAKQNETDAVNARLQVEKQNAELLRSQDILEGTLVQSWLTPLAQEPGLLNAQEVGALQQLRTQLGKPIALRFVREGTRTPQLTRRLRVRADHVWHAVVGLDRQRRAAVETILVAELRSSGSEASRREDLAVALVSLGGLSPESTVAAAQALIQSLEVNPDPGHVLSLAELLPPLVDRMEKADAIATCQQGSPVLTRAMAASNDHTTLCSLAECLARLVAPLGPDQTARHCRAAAETLGRAVGATEDPGTLERLVKAQCSLAPFMDSQERTAACRKIADALVQALARRPASIEHESRAASLSMVVGYLDLKTGGNLLLQAFIANGIGRIQVPLARGLSSLARRMDPQSGTDLLSQALLSKLDRVESRGGGFGGPPPPEVGVIHFGALQMLKEGLATVMERQEPAAAVAALEKRMDATNNPPILMALSEVFAKMAGRLPPAAASKACQHAAERIRLVEQSPGWSGLERLELVKAAALLGTRMQPVEAELRSRETAKKLTGETREAFGWFFGLTVNDWNLQQATPVADILSILLGQLTSADAERAIDEVAAALLEMCEKGIPINYRPYFAKQLAAVARLMPQAKSDRICAELAEQIAADLSKARLDGPFLPPSMDLEVSQLVAITGQMSPKAAGRVTFPIALALAEYIGRSPQNDQAGRLLLALAARLSPDTAAKTVAPILRAMNQDLNEWQSVLLARILVQLADRMTPKEARDVYRRANGAMAQRVLPDRPWQQEIRLTLAEAAARMDPNEGVSSLSQAAIKTEWDLSLVQGLAAVAHRQGRPAATHTCKDTADLLWKALRATANPSRRQQLLLGLSSILRAVNPGDEQHRLAAVVRAVGATSGQALLATPGLAAPALQPIPSPPLSEQDLVELLEETLSDGEVRRTILDELGRRYGQHFKDQWDFVRFVEDRHLTLP
jgi:hypothetical protein